jgi:2-polyprenyl-6-methoxyphenol hydroxylase-like FAD-dependent oxidoreductase
MVSSGGGLIVLPALALRQSGAKYRAWQHPGGSVARRAHIIGGSLGGLMAGLILRRQGWRVDIHERSATALSGRGAGIVSHPMLGDALAAAGVAVEPASLGVAVERRRVLDASGDVLLDRPFPQLLTSWDRLFQLLRGAFPDEHYHHGRTFLGLAQDAAGATARFEDGSSATGDLLVGADGFRSAVRAQLLAAADPTYVGYVAWRGMVPEAEMSAAAHDAIFDSFAFCLPEGEQMLGYPVAGPNNDLRPGRRRYNFVWYRPADKAGALRDLLTDESGRTYALSIAPPLIRRDVIAAMREAAGRTLTPAFAEVVGRTEAPFFQPIFDYAAPGLAFGRVALMGDAAFVARPHVGAGVAKAGADAMALAGALAAGGDVAQALRAYEAARLPVGARIIARARELGAYMQAQQASPEERRHAAAHRTPEAVLEHTASLRFLDDG